LSWDEWVATVDDTSQPARKLKKMDFSEEALRINQIPRESASAPRTILSNCRTSRHGALHLLREKLITAGAGFCGERFQMFLAERGIGLHF
jgi:hypothetical protein